MSPKVIYTNAGGIVEVTAPRDPGQFTLAAIGDIHLGSHTCLEADFRRWVRKIEREKWHWVGMGDMMENALRTTLGDIYDQQFAPDQQLDETVNILRPIAHLCLGMVPGNHGARTKKQVGMDPDYRMARELGVPFHGYKLYIKVKIGDETNWLIMAHHTTGGGRTPGAKLNVIQRLTLINPNCDIYLGGHSHAEVYGTDTVERISGRPPRITTKIRHYVSTGSLLDYAKSYAEAKMMPRATTMQIALTLGRRIHRTADGDDYWEKPLVRIPYRV